MRAILIDPVTSAVTEIDIDGSLQSMYDAIGCDLVEAVRCDNGDTLWLDEEGLIYHKGHGGFVYYDSVQRENVLAGRGLILGVTKGGSNKDCVSKLESVKDNVKFVGDSLIQKLSTYFNYGDAYGDASVGTD